MSMFEVASREKIRFESSKGMLTVENLWDLPLQSKNGDDLDSVAKQVNKDLKETEEESFVNPSTKKNVDAQLKLDIVKHIIKVRLDENKAKLEAQEKSARRKLLLEALQNKQQQNIMNMSEEQIKQELEKV